MKIRGTCRPGLTILILALNSLGACSSEDPTSPTDETSTPEELTISDWTAATHGSGADPDYDEVFADGVVRRLDIVISASDWQAMLDDMTATFGAFNSGGGGPAGQGATENPHLGTVVRVL